jgi:hypothetical protein
VVGAVSANCWVTTMSNVRDRFATLDRIAVPDLWAEVERRAAALGSGERVTSDGIRIPQRSVGSSDRTLALLAAVLLVVLLAGAIAIGSGLVHLPQLVPAPGPSLSSPVSAPSPPPATPAASATAAPSQAASSARAPWIVFVRNVPSEGRVDRGRLWAMRADGSDAQEIYAPGGAVAWSRDGSRLLIDDGSVLVGDVGDTFGPFVDTGAGASGNGQWEGFDFAPDGEHVVFMNKSKCATASAPFGVDVAETAGANCMILSVLDLRTGKRVDLDRTLVKDQTATQNLTLELPTWSPDGTKIAYSRVDEAHGTSELWTVNADGTNPSKVEMDADVSVQEPRWSPDGTRISFTSPTWMANAALDSAVFVVDLASGHLDRITTGSDPAASQLCCAEWLDNARLRVERATSAASPEFWVVGLGSTPREARPLIDLTDSLAAIDPPGTVGTVSAPGDPGRTFFWQPVPGTQP